MSLRLPKSLLLAQALGLLLPIAGHAEWQLSGSNTFRVDSYDVDGDPAHSPYAREGLFSFNELNLSLSGQPLPGRTLRFDFSGVINGSPYRSAHQGVVPEAMRLVYDDTTAALPFRLDLGDQYLSLSQMTLDRSLKAIRFSFWPGGGPGRSLAGHVFIGQEATTWRDLGEGQGSFQGFGLNLRDDRLGTLGVNFVHYRGDDMAQSVGSVYARRGFDLAGQSLALSGEWGYLSGQLVEGGERLAAQGGYLELEGASQTHPLRYRLRYDRYGEHYSPRGGSVIADSEGALAKAGWTFDGGTTVDASVTRLSESASGPNPRHTDTASGALTLPLAAGRGSLRIDGQLQRRKDEAGWVDQRSQSLGAALQLRHEDGDSTRVQAALSRLEDRNSPCGGRRSWQLAASHTLNLEFGDTRLELTPGVALSKARSDAESLTVGPTLALAASRGNHRLGLQYGESRYDSEVEGAGYDHSRLALSYEHHRGKHHFGVEVEKQLREPEAGEETDSLRFSAYWRYDFEATFGGTG